MTYPASVIRGNGRTKVLNGASTDDLILGYGVTQSGNTITDAGMDCAEKINGGSRNDILYGGGGNDILSGGSGADQLFGGTGSDVLNGGSNNDILNGGDGNDLLNGGSNNDILNGDQGNDSLTGGSGDDSLNGGAGNDLIDGGSGSDTYLSSAALNQLSFSRVSGKLCVAGPEGSDSLTSIEWLDLDGTRLAIAKFSNLNGVIALNDSATATENNLELAASALLGNDLSLKAGAAPVIVSGENGLVGQTTEGIAIYLDEGILRFADGETGYDYLEEGESLITHFSYTLGNGSGLTDSATVELTIAGSSENESPAGQSVIDLGVYGQLLAPVNVDGKWYYAWDMNGDGTHDQNWDASGQWDYGGVVDNEAGSGFQYDFVAHDVLDGLFTQDSDGNANPGSETSEIFRFATLNGVQLALPTYGGSDGFDRWYNGTVIDNNPVGESNPAYNDLLAIWDAFNGTGTGATVYFGPTPNLINGTPPGWQANGYWSATPSPHGHAGLSLAHGRVYDGESYYVALEVLGVAATSA